MAEPRAYLIDSSIYIFRAWFSLPDQWYTPEGWSVNAVYGYARFLLEFIEKTQPVHLVAAFDESLGSCFRNDILPSYKSSRELPDEALAFQLEACAELTRLLGIADYGGARYEADDYLASLARAYRKAGIAVTVVTRDKDLGQIVQSEQDSWWDYGADVELDTQGFYDKFNVWPQQFADYLALVGDPVDDIPGVPGVGAKTAAKLLNAFEDLDQLGKALTEDSIDLPVSPRIESALRNNWPEVLQARQLTGLFENIPKLRRPKPFTLRRQSLEDTAAYLQQLGLSGPLTRRCESLIKELG